MKQSLMGIFYIDHQKYWIKLAYVERYNRTVRYEWLEMKGFSTIEEMHLAATQWLWIYNNERPTQGYRASYEAAEAFKLKFLCGLRDCHVFRQPFAQHFAKVRRIVHSAHAYF
jgi:hypothetical protein